MKRATIWLVTVTLVLLATGCNKAPQAAMQIDPIKSYRDIPGITEEEIAAIEALKDLRLSFSYGQMFETEAFILPDGTHSGFAAKFCELLSTLFDIPFVLQIHDWDELKRGLDAKHIDFTGDLTPTAERMQYYYMTHPIAERSLRIFTDINSAEINTEKDVNGLDIGFLAGSIDAESVKESYPELIFTVVEVNGFAEAAELLKKGKIDAFVSEGVIDPYFNNYGYIRSKEFFTLVYTPVSLTTANPELEPIISAVNKYIASGGIDVLYSFYKEGDAEYSHYKLSKSFTAEEQAYMDMLAASGMTVNIALEQDNYPACFYNDAEEEFQGIAVDVLAEISQLTGINFVTVNDQNTSWSQILEMLKTGQASMVSQLLHSEERKNDFLWSEAPYASTYYALLSKADYPNLAIYQVVRAKVGSIDKSAFTDKYNEWFANEGNLVPYATQNEALSALESGEIDLLMGSDYMLLTQLNYREKPSYKANIHFNVPMDSFFGFNKNEATLCSIISKAQAYVKTDLIDSDWINRGYDYSKKMAQQRSLYLLIIAAVLFLILILTISFLLKNRKLNRNLEELVKKRTYELEQQTAAAQVASKAKGSFLARMSHEIRTPLNAIIGMAGIAKNSIDDPEKNLSSINQIISSSNHLLGILNDVLDMSKIESGKLELVQEPFSFLNAYDEVSDIIAQRCHEKSISFTTNMDELKDMVLIGDKLRLNQVLINLLGNAVKFTAKEGRISFLAHVLAENGESARIRFSVTDSGIGMTEEQLGKLFIPFEQADNTIAAKFGGTGLGLSISQNLVGMMGGEIKVESRPQAGTRFYFDLSFEKGQMTAAAEDAAPNSLDLSGKRILLVEDVEVNRLIICEILSPTGVEIEEAEDGQRAVEIFDHSAVRHYDLIFMDIQMPVMNGYQATTRIRALTRADAQSIPIIAMTANAYKEDVEEALAAGMNGHLAKPINIDALMNTLAKYLKGRS